MLRLINASADFFKYALNVTPQTLSGLNGALLTRMMPAKGIHVSSSSGTRLDIGVLVADGAFNLAVSTTIDARLANHPVTIEIRDGRVVSYSCGNSSVRRLLGRFFDAKNTDRVGELGFGTNVGIQRFIPLNSHINERHPGVHLGLGAHQQRLDAVKYQCDIHLDLITSDATIVIDDDEVIQSSNLANFQSEHHPDPLREGIGDEDLDGDCCGVIAAEVAKARAGYLRLTDRR